MTRFALILLLIIFVARAFWRLIDGVIDGLGGGTAGRTPARGVSMARDPICGTFVVPENAIRLSDGREVHYFCSTACRDKYRARTA